MVALTILTPLDTADRARPALITDTVSWSFATLARAVAAQSQRFFAETHIVPSSRVAFVAAPTPEVFLAIHTLAALGATLVPLHPRLSPAEVHVALGVARVTHLLDANDLALPAIAPPAALPPASPSALPPASPSALPPASPSAPSPLFDPASFPPIPNSAPFAIVSTSGTTGRPKGAVLSRRAILAAAAASAHNLGWQPDDRWLLCMPLAHVGGLSIVTRCLLARRPVVLLPRFDPHLVLDAIRRHAVTLLSVVPTMLHALLGADTDDTLRRPRALLLGGAAAPPALLDACAARGIRALTTYGLTEACSQVTSQAPRDPSQRLPGSGAPLPGFELRITSEIDGPPLPPHHVGQVLVRGPALFDGYLTEGGETLDPARTADGFFATGDLGELDATGQLHVHVRRTDLIVTGGENVYPAEVEQAIETCPQVRRALVFAVPDERWGQLVAAAIEIDPASPPAQSMLAEILSSTLAPHKRPRRITFVDQLPLTPSGKVDRKDAASRFNASLAPFPPP